MGKLRPQHGKASPPPPSSLARSLAPSDRLKFKILQLHPADPIHWNTSTSAQGWQEPQERNMPFQHFTH